MRKALGVDADTKGTGWALVSSDKEVLACGILTVYGMRGLEGASAMAGVVAGFEWPRCDVAVVEGQEVYSKGKANANNLIPLAMVTGAAAGVLHWKACEVIVPKPRRWKGQMGKGAHQAWVLDQIGWEYEFKGKKNPPVVGEIPPEVKVVGNIPEGSMKEVVDAIGLALWGLER